MADSSEQDAIEQRAENALTDLLRLDAESAELIRERAAARARHPVREGPSADYS
ncbi:MAG: hypothetical protein ABI345_11785 [Jatrophihabitans sp.]